MPTDQELCEQIELVHQKIDQAHWGITVMGNGEAITVESFYPPGVEGLPADGATRGLMSALKLVACTHED